MLLPIRCTLFITIFFVKVSTAQNIIDSVDFYISKLDTNSASLIVHYRPQLYYDENVARLIELEVSNMNAKLIANLSDKRKVLAIHFILTKRLTNDQYSYGESYVYQNGHIIQVDYSFNNFKWTHLVHSRRNVFEEKELKHVKEYWVKFTK